MIRKSTAIIALVPNSRFNLIDQKEIIWYDSRPEPTDEEIQAKIAELEAEEPMRLLRIERNRRLTAVDWWTSRALDGTALTEAQKSYRQQLRDLPKMITPDDSSEPLPAPTIDENGQLVFDHWPTYSEDK